MRPRTVLVVGPLPPPRHGASHVTEAVLAEVRALAAAATGTRVRVVSTAATGAGPRYHLRRAASHVRAGIAVLAARARGPVVVYVGGAGSGGLWYQAAVLAVARAAGAVPVFHHHSYNYLLPGEPPARVMTVLARLLGPSGTHVCLSEGMAATFRARYRTAAAVVVVSNARVVEAPGTVTGDHDGPVDRLVHVSNLTAEKGVLDVLDAFDDLRARGREVGLTLVGPADPEVQAAIDGARRRHGAALRHTGPLDRDGVARELAGAAVFVFPSRYRHESHPLVVHEALAAGVPVLATARGAVAELLPPGWLVDEVTPLADQVTQLLDDDREALRALARAHYERSRAEGIDLPRYLVGSS
ncbi:glycosyltransferase family 4 protein [Actinomycetospora aeridis]|uniref:Glycosyltransferase family 4 protein n=1 Tax=Actinomycetospora aeridis TaxID=3129231 RepID=A0ABU8N7M1_9PSEU